MVVEFVTCVTVKFLLDYNEVARRVYVKMGSH